VLATPDRYRGAGQGGADCYTELRRILLLGTSVNKQSFCHFMGKNAKTSGIHREFIATV
jgi:hypothetical protein